MRFAKAVPLLVLLACATAPRPQYRIATRDERPPDCALDYYDANHPAPAALTELGRFPLQVSVTIPAETLPKLVAPRACKVGATAVQLLPTNVVHFLGDGQRIREVEAVLLAPPEAQD